MTQSSLCVGVIGYGAIGSVVANGLHRGHVPGATLAGVATRNQRDLPTGRSVGLEELLETSDVVAECAGHDALRRLAPRVLAAGRDLIVASIGALADDAVFDAIQGAGPGRVRLTTGALGGIDLVRAASFAGPLHHVRLTTTKHASAFRRSRPQQGESETLAQLGSPVVLFDGPAREASTRFPQSANVAAALAFAVGDWDRVTVTIVADPDIDYTSHEITCSGDVGEYQFHLRNRPSPTNPATSAIVPYAILRGIADDVAAWRFQ